MFFVALAHNAGNVTKTCESLGFSRESVYLNCKRNKEFAVRFEKAKEQGVDRMEDEATRRAVDGVAKSVFFQGQECGTVQEYSDGLVQFLLKANRPEKYKERSSVDVNSSDARPLQHLSNDELEEILKKRQK